MIAVLLIVTAFSATPYNDTFDKALQAYESADYATAVVLYEQLVAEGVVAPELFYNLGNAYMQQNRPGPALAKFERALRLDPALAHAKQNRQLCIQQTQAKNMPPAPPVWEQNLLFWHFGISLRGAVYAFTAAWFALWGLLALRSWRPFPLFKSGLAIATLTLCLMAMSVYAKIAAPVLAVVSSPTVAVRYTADLDEGVRFELVEGDTVVVDAEEGEWYRIAAGDGNRGWLPRSDVTLVGPPYQAAPEPRGPGPEKAT